MEILESFRLPFGPFFLRLDVRRASKRLPLERDQEFHEALVKAFYELRSLGLEAHLGFVISDELNVLLHNSFGRRVEKVLSLYASTVSLSLQMPVDARIVYTPSLLSASEYLAKRQELGYRNAVLKQAFVEALKAHGDRRKAHQAISHKRLDELVREYSHKVPKRALYGELLWEERESFSFVGREGKSKLVAILSSIKLPRLERLVRSHAGSL